MRIERLQVLELLGNLGYCHGLYSDIGESARGQVGSCSFSRIAWIEDQPAVLFSITEGVVKAVLPEYGRVQFSIDHWLDGNAGARLLLLQRGREAHNRKLGLSWFMPQIRKYRRSLTEVLLASLVLAIA